MRIRNKKINSVIFTWLISYISILLIPMIVSAIVFTESSKIYEKEINRVNYGMLKQVEQALGSRLEDIERVVQQISLNSEVKSLFNVRKPLSGFHQYNVNKVIKDLKTYKASNGFIDDLYIYLKGPNTVLTTNNHLDAELFYQYFYSTNDMSYELWHDFISDTHVKKYISIMQKMHADDEKRKIMYVQSLPYENPREASATFVILIDEIHFLEAIRNIELVSNGIIMIIDKNNNILSSTENLDLPLMLQYDKLEGESGVINSQINGENVVVSYIASQHAQWKYISIIPTEIFWEKLRYIRLLTDISVVVSLLIGVIVVFLFLRKNYNPIKNILTTLSEKMQISGVEGSNEYSFIEEAISKTFKENEKINEELRLQNKELSSNFLKRLFKGRVESKVSIYDTLSAFDIQFKSEYFSIMVFNIEDYSGLFKDDKDLDDNDRIKFVHFILTNVIEELIGQNNQGFMVEIDEEIMACLINYDSGKEGNSEIDISRVVDETQQFCAEHFNISFNVSVSAVHKSIMGISKAYQEALEVMEYKMVVGSNKLIFYDEIIAIKQPKYNYDYSLETEYQLINFIKVGDFNRAKDILDEVFEKNLSNETVSIQIVKCLMFNMVSTMLKTINELKRTCDNVFFEEVDIIEPMLKCETILDMKNQIVNSLKNVCGYISENKRSNHNHLIEDIIVFINKNYSDVNLSIAMLGEQFKMTPSYIGTIFKEGTSEGLLDFINKVRIEKAKKILEDKSLNISDIALKVGYSSSNVFIRAFKKYEGITPGKYKEI